MTLTVGQIERASALLASMRDEVERAILSSTTSPRVAAAWMGQITVNEVVYKLSTKGLLHQFIAIITTTHTPSNEDIVCASEMNWEQGLEAVSDFFSNGELWNLVFPLYLLASETQADATSGT